LTTGWLTVAFANTFMITGCDYLSDPDLFQGQLHVTGVLPFVLPVKSLHHNIVTDVTDFPDLSIKSGEFGVQSDE
jgi:hypothetical protein